jgi:type IV pilus assembly protein PilA
MKKNAFTLVELLAVIAILTIIMVISVPQLITSIKNKKTDALEKTKDLLISAARNYVIDYELKVPTSISIETLCKNDYLECPIKNPIDNSNLNGYVNVDDNKVYVYSDTRDYITIKDYIIDLYNDESLRTSNGLKKDNTVDTNIRYYGSDPNNYVSFNNELWRIIGVFGNNVKLVRSESLGSLSWDSSDSSINKGNGINQWGESTDVNGNTYLGANLQVYLNKMYYGGDTTVTCYDGSNNTTTTCPTNTLDRTAKLLIDKHTWSLGAIEMSIEDTISFYNAERGTANGKTCTSGTYCNDSVIRTTKWTGYVALPYITDWAYASSESACETNIQTKDSSNLFVCKNNNWMQRSDWTWYLSPGVQSANANYVWTVSGNGNVANYIMFGAMSKFAYYGSNVAPSIYLKSSVLMKGGSGTSSDPYKLA